MPDRDWQLWRKREKKVKKLMNSAAVNVVERVFWCQTSCVFECISKWLDNWDHNSDNGRLVEDTLVSCILS